MPKIYIKPTVAFRKLRFARELRQPVYVYGATGFGKTALAEKYLEDKHYFYCSALTGSLIPEEIPEGNRKTPVIVVIDDIQFLQNSDDKKRIADMLLSTDYWVIILSRCTIPGWLVKSSLKTDLLTITETDLTLTKENILEYYNLVGMPFAEEAAGIMAEMSIGGGFGNGYAVSMIANAYKNGSISSAEDIRERNKYPVYFFEHLENNVISMYDADIVEFLMKVSVVNEFDIPMAETITGDCHISALIQKCCETGFFLVQSGNTYKMRSIMLMTIRRRAERIYGTKSINEYAFSAGMHFEKTGRDIEALKMYEKCGNRSRIKDILIRNARKNPGAGHFYELKKYYFELSDDEIKQSPVLISGMSMLYSLMMDEKMSEYWYDMLKTFRDDPVLKREAMRQQAYLDIALPHRGSAHVADIIMNAVKLFAANGIKTPELSITSNMPSTMNGGKDFCDWSLYDNELAAAIGKPMESFFGKIGKGFLNAAMGESLYEKCGSKYEVASKLSKSQLESEADGKPEITFAAVGLQIRMHITDGNIEAAEKLLYSFYKKMTDEGCTHLMPNIEALNCRIALYKNDIRAINSWMKKAPDENREFYILDRYRYLTKIRCYIAKGEYMTAFMLIEKLRSYGEKYDRKYVVMELGLLTAILKKRSGDPWKEDFIHTLEMISHYRFIRIISEECSAIKPLLEEVRAECEADSSIDSNWFRRVLEETSRTALRYPSYLESSCADIPKISGNALTILKLQAEGMSNTQIAEKLGMKSPTVKYHMSENYRKLGVNSKTDAILKARSLNIL